MFILDDVTCGNILTMDEIIPSLTSTIVTLVKIGIPVLLIVFGMLDLGKAVMAQKEEEIKKAQQMFVKRILSAALVFFVVVIVQLVFNLVAKGSDQKDDIWDCISCFVSGEGEHSANYCRKSSAKK